MPDSGEDGDLMRRLLADDTVAFSAMYDRHAAAVYGLALRILRDRTAAEDVAQEAFVALWRDCHSYSSERGTAGAWLLTITRNRAIDAIRHGHGHRHAALDDDYEREAPERTDEEALRRVEAGIIGVAEARHATGSTGYGAAGPPDWTGSFRPRVD